MKRITLITCLLVFIQGIVFAGLTLSQPKGGEFLVRGAQYPIKWTAPVSEGEQKVDIYLGDKLIANSSKKKDGSYNWTVGKLKNGSYVPPGKYKIVLESLDGDAFGKEFTIFVLIPVFPKIDKLTAIPIPNDCPMCYRLDLRPIKTKVKDLRGRFYLKLFKNNRLVADLGQCGGRYMLPDYAKIKIPGNRLAKLRKAPGTGYELRLFDAKGKCVEKKAVKLQI
ncbi:MAG: hypothetical protein GY950_09800 [bacterium]|nr:hypothetical protein [bacterium]